MEEIKTSPPLPVMPEQVGPEGFKAKVILFFSPVKNYWLKVPEKLRKVSIISALVLIVALVLAVSVTTAISFSKLGRGTDQAVRVTPTPSAVITPGVISNPSRYATDSGVIKAEQDLSVLRKELDEMKVNDADLLPPKLDFDISFTKQ
jgi:hypothetical protein